MMMPMILPPVMPIPPRAAFTSDEAYAAAQLRQHEANKRRTRMMKEHEASLIIMAAMFAAVALCILAVVGYGLDGVRGAIGVPLGVVITIFGLMRLQNWVADRL